MITAYVSGGMTGYPAFNFPMFDEVTDYLRKTTDWKVISPAEHDRELICERNGVLARAEDFPGYDVGDHVTWGKACGFTYDGALAWDLGVIATECDALVMLPAWEFSGGAKSERFVGERKGCDIYLAYRTMNGWRILADPMQKRMDVQVLPVFKAAS